MTKPGIKQWLYILCKKRYLEIGTNSKEVGKICGVSRETIERWLKSPQNARIEDIRDVLQVLGYTKEEAASIFEQIIINSWRKVA